MAKWTIVLVSVLCVLLFFVVFCCCFFLLLFFFFFFFFFFLFCYFVVFFFVLFVLYADFRFVDDHPYLFHYIVKKFSCTFYLFMIHVTATRIK